MSFGINIEVSNTLEDVKILTPSVSEDSRGNIWTSYTSEEIDTLLPADLSFKHDKFSMSKKNVLRGLHGDHKSWKLVTCVYGQICQVVVDLREDSPSYLQSHQFIIDSSKPQSILIPPGMGNGYFVISPTALYHYKLAYNGDYIDADQQFTIKWNDPRLKITWPTDNPILSNRDKGEENVKN